MGKAHSPVRDVVDAAFDRFLAPRIPVLWVLTVTEDTPEGVVHRGVFVGRGRSGESGGAAYEAAADLSARCNIEVVSTPLGRVTCWLDPDEFRTTWVANKAVYRTRMALADGGDLVVLAPGVSRFGEDADDRCAHPPPRLPRHPGRSRRRSSAIPSSPRTSASRRTSSTAAAKVASASSTAQTPRPVA